MRNRNFGTLKFVLSAFALIFLIAIAFAFKNQTVKTTDLDKKLDNVPLHFKYMGTTFTDNDVKDPTNWEKIDDEAELCDTDDNIVACSFSISVPEGDASSYYNNSTKEGTSRLKIDVTGTSQAYVSDVKDNLGSQPSIDIGINNQPLP